MHPFQAVNQRTAHFPAKIGPSYGGSFVTCHPCQAEQDATRMSYYGGHLRPSHTWVVQVKRADTRRHSIVRVFDSDQRPSCWRESYCRLDLLVDNSFY